MKIPKIWISFQTHEPYELNHFWIFKSRLNDLVSFSVLTVINIVWINMIWLWHSDIISGDLAWNILRNNAYKISYKKKRKVNITERRRNGDWMALNGDRMVTEMYLPFSRLNGDWKVTEWRLQFSRNRGVSSCELNIHCPHIVRK